MGARDNCSVLYRDCAGQGKAGENRITVEDNAAQNKMTQDSAGKFRTEYNTAGQCRIMQDGTGKRRTVQDNAD
jgi:hypothetical protein